MTVKMLFGTLLLLASSGAVGALNDEDEVITPHTDYAVISPDGQSIAYVSNIGGSKDIWIAERDGSNPRRLLTWENSSETHPDWSPSGDRIAFTSNYQSRQLNIWTVSVDGSNPVQVTKRVFRNKNARYSPDGTKFVFVSNRTGKNQIWLMDVDGGNQKVVGMQFKSVSSPAWSPSGDRIVYVGCVTPKKSGLIAFGDIPCNLYITNHNMSKTTQVTSGLFNDWNPDWGIEGIVFATNREDSQGLMTIDSDGSNLQRLTSPLYTGDLHPRWSPDDNFVIFSRSGIEATEGSPNIWETNLFGKEVQVTAINNFGEDNDVDGDGVANASDQCENTPANAIVKPEEGCSIEQLCPCGGPRDSTESWRNHGGYVSCAAKASEDFMELALITEEEKDVIVATAAVSSCGEN